MIDFPVASPLASDVLARSKVLPTKPEPIELEGRHVRLRPLDLKGDLEALFAVSNGSPISIAGRHVEAYDADEKVWRYMSNGPYKNSEELASFLRAQTEAENGLCLCVFDMAMGAPVGVTNYMNNVPGHLKVELGNIWYSPIVQRTKVNLEATYLMLSHMFGLGYRRIEWKCDANNERSRRAATRMGFRFEGIQQSHLIVKGRNRDTAWFRILDHEWSDTKQHLERLLLA
jgi:RimJ/RimL family protein N-acetyltransferase